MTRSAGVFSLDWLSPWVVELAPVLVNVAAQLIKQMGPKLIAATTGAPSGKPNSSTVRSSAIVLRTQDVATLKAAVEEAAEVTESTESSQISESHLRVTAIAMAVDPDGTFAALKQRIKIGFTLNYFSRRASTSKL